MTGLWKDKLDTQLFHSFSYYCTLWV